MAVKTPPKPTRRHPPLTGVFGVPSTLYARWRSKAHVGAAAPTLRVVVERGLMDKTYQPYINVSGKREYPIHISNGKNTAPWQGFWRSTDAKPGVGTELPNVLSVKWDATFQQKGARTATIEVENVIYKAITGSGGIFHQIARGYLSPTLGAKLLKRARALGTAQNEWYEVLNNGYKVTIWEGYGDQQIRTFVGMIDSADLESHPDRITITARSFFALLTDQRMMGANKDPEIRSPVTFCDKKEALSKANGYQHDKWVLTNDVSEAVRAVLVWVGFHEWKLQRINKPQKWPTKASMDKFMIDVIDAVLALSNAVFYEGLPSPASQSIGVPTLEENSAMMNPPASGLLQISDSDMLESIQPKFDLSNLPYVFRARGKPHEQGGHVYDMDTQPRYMGTYFPPWSGANVPGKKIVEAGRTGGLRRHAYSINEELDSDKKCLLSAIVEAQRYALEAFTAQFQIAGFPGLQLNQQVSVISNSTGINSRLWISELHSEHTTGKDGKWHMTVGGALLDTLDLQYLQKDFLKVGGLGEGASHL